MRRWCGIPGRHLALIELAASPEIAALSVADGLYLRALGHGDRRRGTRGLPGGRGCVSGHKLATGGLLLALFETSIAKMRVFRVGEFLGAALMLGLLGTLLLFVPGVCDARSGRYRPFLAGGMVVASFLLLYQIASTP